MDGRKKKSAASANGGDRMEGPIWFEAVPGVGAVKPLAAWLKDAEQDRALAVLAARYLRQNARDLKAAVEQLWLAPGGGDPLVEFLSACERRAKWHEDAATALRAVIARLCLVGTHEVAEDGRRVDGAAT